MTSAKICERWREVRTVFLKTDSVIPSEFLKKARGQPSPCSVDLSGLWVYQPSLGQNSHKDLVPFQSKTQGSAFISHCVNHYYFQNQTEEENQSKCLFKGKYKWEDIFISIAAITNYHKWSGLTQFLKIL